MFSFIKSLFGGSSDTENTDSNMKYLIAGLGNIGTEYDDTRHNIGFEILDRLARKFEVSFKNDTLGSIAEIKYKGRTFILLKPSTYMNLSGKAVRYWLQKEKIQPENLLVVLDDLQLPFGKQRLRPKGSDGGHNGLKSIDQLLGSNVYARLRIGIGDDFKQGRQVDYVLGKWTDKEYLELPDITLYAMDTILAFGAIGMELAMSNYNKDRKK
jgi:peptidyl-tRNA hydrolase, PTH1 family